MCAHMTMEITVLLKVLITVLKKKTKIILGSYNSVINSKKDLFLWIHFLELSGHEEVFKFSAMPHFSTIQYVHLRSLTNNEFKAWTKKDLTSKVFGVNCKCVLLENEFVSKSLNNTSRNFVFVKKVFMSFQLRLRFSSWVMSNTYCQSIIYFCQL